MLLEKKATIFLLTKDDCKFAATTPFKGRKEATISMINSLEIRTTDCRMTFDFMMKELEKCKILIRNLSSLEMFEILINMNRRGIENMRLHLFREWNHSDVNIWDYRKTKETLDFIHEKYNA
jgi:hypothetical protein